MWGFLCGGGVFAQKKASEALFTVAIVKRSLKKTIELRWHPGSLENLPTSSSHLHCARSHSLSLSLGFNNSEDQTVHPQTIETEAQMYLRVTDAERSRELVKDAVIS